MPIEFNGSPRYGNHEISVKLMLDTRMELETKLSYIIHNMIPEPMNDNENDATVTFAIIGTVQISKNCKRHIRLIDCAHIWNML